MTYGSLLVVGERLNPAPVLNCHFCVSQCLFLSHCEILPQPSQAAAFQPAGGQRQMNRSCVCSQFKLYPFSVVQAPAAAGIPAQHTLHSTTPVETLSSQQCTATSAMQPAVQCGTFSATEPLHPASSAAAGCSAGAAAGCCRCICWSEVVVYMACFH